MLSAAQEIEGIRSKTPALEQSVPTPKAEETSSEVTQDTKIQSLSKIALVQARLDSIGIAVETMFINLSKITGFYELNERINHIIKGDWKYRLINTLWQIPVQAAFKVILNLYRTIKESLVVAVHPIDSSKRLLNVLKDSILSIQEPDNWSSPGGYFIGSTLALQSINAPISDIGLIFGVILIVAGVSTKVIMDFLKPPKEGHESSLTYFMYTNSKNHIYNASKTCFESLFLLYFMVGLIFFINE